jgi:CRISPR-associated protein Cmr2
MWMGRMELLGRLAEAGRGVRHVPEYRAAGDVPQKCSLLGTYEQMGPARLKESGEFWDDWARLVRLRGTRTRPNERLCAVSLVKRFAWPALLADRLGLPVEELRFADTATVAAALWLREHDGSPAVAPDRVRREHGDWSGQWLHWQRPDQGGDDGEEPVPPSVWEAIRAKRHQQGPAPTYYAVLMIDGDHMGRWLRGEKTPPVGRCLHPRLRDYFAALPGTGEALAARRPVTPALHAAISEALTNFALHFVPAIVEGDGHAGTLIYAGGDDVLALLPVRTALACARGLEETFRRDWAADAGGRERLLMGGQATVSAGLAVVHYKEDLRFALDQARAAEKCSKEAGRNALTLTVCRRSGEHTTATLPWALAAPLDGLVDQFAGEVSDRWAYHLRAELPTLQGVPWPAVAAETRRLLQRLEGADPTRLGQHREAALGFLESYRREMTGGRGRTEKEALEGFVTLCQAASFLARGRDE